MQSDFLNTQNAKKKKNTIQFLNFSIFEYINTKPKSLETKKVKYNGMVKALVALVVCLVNEKRKRYFSILKQVTNNQKRITKIVTIYAVLLTTVVTAQVYPVQVTPQLVPPYSLKLSDYQTTSSEKLFVNLLLTDVNELGRQVRLKMYIEGEGLNIQTLDFVAGANPINLDGGINQRLSNLDLRPYFNLNNLLGITPEQYNTSLPEGRYDFCFEVYDFLSGQQLSRKSCFSVYLILNEPPILNIPGNSDLVTAKNPQNIIFNWTPRHLNATNVQYEYTLKELWDTKIDPQAAFLASPALHQETTFATTLLYGPANTQLLEGKTYGWQVRALVSDGISETSVFRNDGYSEIFYFNYVGDCDTPSFIISEAESSKTVKILWQYSDHIRYEIQYRKKGYGDDDWFSAYAYNQETTIRNLEEGTVYEFRVGGECTTNGGFAFSEIHEFTTPTEEEEAYYNCGIPPEIKISNQDPLPKIGASETFTAGDFPVVVVEVSGGNGNFSGWGYITLPFLAKVNQAINLLDNATEDENGEGGTSIGKYTRIRVEFKGISINTDYQLTAGTVETSYDPNWGGILSVDDLVDYITGDEGDIATYHAENTNLADVIVNDAGNIILIDTDGNEIPIEVRKPVVITDSEGEQWTVHEDGTVTEGGYAAEGGAPTSSNTNGIANNGDVTQISSKDVTVVFKPSGFYDTDALRDDITDEKFTKNYESIPQANGGDYNVLYKALSDLSSNTTDVLTAEASFSNNKTKDDIVFKTKQGTAVAATWSGNTATIQLKRTFEFGKDEILATVKPKDSTAKYDVAGKVNVWHLQQKEINLTIVPIGNATVSSSIKDEINEIYNVAGVNFNITVAPSFSINQSDWDVENSNGKLDIGDSNTLANYTIEERAIFNKYKAQNSVNSQMYYMFVLGSDISTTDSSIDGFMPLKRQYGFAFNPSEKARTIAHELGHGIFGLKHPFIEYSITQGSTDLLMDYGSGKQFTNMDWQKMHEPGLQLYWFQGDEDGESATVVNMESLKDFANSNDTFTFYTIAGKIITLPPTISSVTFSTGETINTSECDNTDFEIQPIGALIAFEYEGKRYSARWSCSNKQFLYFKNDEGGKYEDIYFKNSWSDFDQVIIGFPVVENNDIFFKVKSFSSSIISEQELNRITSKEIYYGAGDIVSYNHFFNLFELATDNYFHERTENIYAVLTPEFTSNIKNFLKTNLFTETDLNGEEINYYKENAYLFIHAHQLQKYNWMEGCFTDGIPNSIFSGIIGVYWKDDIKVKEINDLLDNKKLAKAIVKYWEDGNYIYPLFNEYSTKLENISSIDSPSEIMEVLKLLGTYDEENNSCLWDKISSDDKEHILEVFSDENFSDVVLDSENYLLSIFKSLDDSDGENFLKLLEKDEYKVLRYLWDVENGVFSTSQEADFIGIITSWFLKNRVSEDYVDNIYREYLNHYINVDDPKPSRIDSFEGLNYLPFYDANWFNDVSFFNHYDLQTDFEHSSNSDIDIKLNTNFIDYNNPDLLTINEIYKRTLKPFSPVVIEFVDGVSLNGKSFEKGSRLAVPAIFLHWIRTNEEFKENMVAVRVIGDLIAIGLAPYTFGGSTSLMYVEVAAASIDIFFAIYEEEIAEELGPEAIKIWNSVYGIYNLYYLTTGAAKLLEYTLNSSSKISKIKINYDKIDDFVDEIKAMPLEKQEEILKHIDDAIYGFKNISGYQNTSEVFKVMLEVRFKVMSNITDASTSLKIDQLNIVVTRNTNTISLGKIDVDYGVPTLTDNIRFLPETITADGLTVLGKLDISYLQDGILNKGIFDIVQSIANKNQFYLKLLSSLPENYFASGAALRNYLNAIPAADVPVGVTMNDDIFRSLSKYAESEFNATPDKMTDHTVYSSWGRYDLDGEENAMYLSQTVAGNETEISHYGEWLDYNTYRFSGVELTKLLDLTNENVLSKLKVLKDQLILTSGTNEVIYEFTNQLASWARDKGFNGIIAWGARGSQDYKNIILFYQNYIDNVVRGKPVTRIPKGLDEYPNLLESLNKLPDEGESYLNTFFNKGEDILKKLEAYPENVVIWSNHTDDAKILLADNVDVWLKYIEAKPLLKVKKYDDVIKLFGGLKVESYTHKGYNYVIDGNADTKALDDAIEITNSITDIDNISSKLNIPKNVIEKVKKHFFIDEHLIKTEIGFQVGRFERNADDIAFWKEAENGFTKDVSWKEDGTITMNLSKEESKEYFNKLISHEYIELRLMEEGFSFRSLKELNVRKPYDLGAHDLAPTLNGTYGNSFLNSTVPLPNSSLSNLEEIVLEYLRLLK